MTRFKLFLLVILFASVHFPGSAQEILYIKAFKKQNRLRWKAPVSEWQANTNAIMKEIAKIVLREPNQVDVRYQYMLTIMVTRHERQNRLAVFMTDRKVTGDCWFRSFPLEPVLFPAILNLRLRIAGITDTSSYSESVIRETGLWQKDSLVGYYSIPSFDPKLDTLIVGEPEHFYDSSAVNSFFKRIDLVNDYYASSAMLDTIAVIGDEVKLTDPSRLPLDFIRITEINRVVNLVRAYDFRNRLTAAASDPVNLQGKLTAMDKLSRSFSYTLNESLSSDVPLQWDGNLQAVADYFAGRVLSYVHRSQLMDHLYGKIYQAYLVNTAMTPPDAYFNGYPLPLLEKMFPAAAKDTLARFYDRYLISSCKVAARGLMAGSRYAEAFALVEHIRLYLLDSGGAMTLDEGLADIQARAAEGVLNSYAGIAATCIKSRKYDMADLYLARAGEYAAGKRDYIRSDSVFRAVFSELFFMRNADCEQLLSAKHYQAALDCYSEFEQVYPQRDLALVAGSLEIKKQEACRGLLKDAVARLLAAAKNHDDSLMIVLYPQTGKLVVQAGGDRSVSAILDSLAPQMAEVQYVQLVETGIVALDRRQFTLSLTLFRQAKSLSEKYSLTEEPGFDSLYRRSLGNYLLVQLTGAQRHIWNTDYDSAYYYLNRIRKEGFDNGFSTDRNFNLALGRFEQRIQDQRCRTVQDSIELWMIRADRSIILKNFSNVSVYLRNALNLVNSKPGCRFDDKAIRDTLARYQWAIQYQEVSADIAARVASGAFDDAILKLEENELSYQKNRLDRFGLTLESTFDFVSARANPFLTFAAINHYSTPGKGFEAFRYLRLLSIQRLPERETTLLQRQVATILARDDYYRSSKEDPLKQVDYYTNGDNWFLAFRNAYMEEWMKMLKK